MTSTSPPRQVKLEKECELRIEVGENFPLRLRLLNGNAEIFGTEIPPEIWLNFPPRLKFAVFTWHGATIEMDGGADTSDYVADETPMISYVNVHAVLEARRNRAKASSSSDSDNSQWKQIIPITQRERTWSINQVFVKGLTRDIHTLYLNCWFKRHSKLSNS